MADADSNQEAPPNTSAEARPANAGPQPNNARHRKAPSASTTADPHVVAAAAASIDELLAKEAIANLKRMRATAHMEPVKSKPRVPIPPARLVVRPAMSQAWMKPFISLAAIVGISTTLCAGGLAYLFLQPVTISKTSDAELRNMRESLAQLRRNVAELSNEVATNRTALAEANKASSDRLARLTQNLDRAKRDQALPAGRNDRMADSQSVRLAQADPSSDVTGTIQPASRPTNARPVAIPGWRVRRAYEGVAVLDGHYGVIEVVLGQDVPDIGRIQDIKFEDGRWQVLTTMGAIHSAP